jgi:hypothetical protein
MAQDQPVTRQRKHALVAAFAPSLSTLERSTSRWEARFLPICVLFCSALVVLWLLAQLTLPFPISLFPGVSGSSFTLAFLASASRCQG